MARLTAQDTAEIADAAYLAAQRRVGTERDVNPHAEARAALVAAGVRAAAEWLYDFANEDSRVVDVATRLLAALERGEL
jgi:hypothetical protein